VAGPSEQQGGAQQAAVLTSRRPQGLVELAQGGYGGVQTPGAACTGSGRVTGQETSPDACSRPGTAVGLARAGEEPHAAGMGHSDGSEKGEKRTQGGTLKQEPEAMGLPGGLMMQVTAGQPKGLGRAARPSFPWAPVERARLGAHLGREGGRKGQSGPRPTSAADTTAAGAVAEKKVAGGAAGGLKRDARRKKGKLSEQSPPLWGLLVLWR